MRSDNDVVQPSSHQAVKLDEPSSCSAVIQLSSRCPAIQPSSRQAVELFSH
jgi:hypothetical protein